MDEHNLCVHDHSYATPYTSTSDNIPNREEIKYETPVKRLKIMSAEMQCDAEDFHTLSTIKTEIEDVKSEIDILHTELIKEEPVENDTLSADSSCTDTASEAESHYQKLSYNVEEYTTEPGSQEGIDDINDMKSLLKFFRCTQLIGESSETIIKASVPDCISAIFNRMLKGPAHQQYCRELVPFVLTLNLFSPRAYNYIRHAFNDSLPHSATVNKCYASTAGLPGFCQEALTNLKMKTESDDRATVCALLMEEMQITKVIQSHNSKLYGFVDFNTHLQGGDELPEATAAWVFMIADLSNGQMMPIGYFLIHYLNSFERAELVRKCLDFVHTSGAVVASITCQASTLNFEMAEELGCDFTDAANPKSGFYSPLFHCDVQIFFDTDSLLRSVKHSWQCRNVLTDHSGNEINWGHVTKIVPSGTTSTDRVMSFKVAKILSKLGKAFEATANFVQTFHDLVHILNSKNRSPNRSTKRLHKRMEHCVAFISGLKLNGRPILKSRIKTGYLGFLINATSLKHLHRTYVKDQKLLDCIVTNDLSLNHLLNFFGSIKYPAHPSALEFETHWTKLIEHRETTTSAEMGNECIRKLVPVISWRRYERIIESALY